MWKKRLKMFYNGSAMWRKLRMTGSLKGSIDVGECAGSSSVSRPRKRWIDTVKDCLEKRGLDVRMVHNRSVWGGK